MKNSRLFHRILFAAGIAAAWLFGASAPRAVELELDPNLGTFIDGIYEVAHPEIKIVWLYSKPIDVTPGGLYRFKMNACWFGEGGGCFPAGIEDGTTDYLPAGDPEPKTLCTRPIRVKDDLSQVRLAVGRWSSIKTIRFTEPTFVPIRPLYTMIREGENTAAAGSFLPLGTGERVEGNRYTFQDFTREDNGNFSRPLLYSDAAFNTNRWCFKDNQSVVYRFDLRAVDPARPDTEEPLRFLSGQVSVEVMYLNAGRCLVEMSTDGQNWSTVGSADKSSSIVGTAEELFTSPAESIYVRCRADESCPDNDFQIISLGLDARLDTDRFSGQGETIFADVDDENPNPDKRFSAEPLYFNKEKICCKVTNNTDQPQVWPTLSYSVTIDGGEPVTCAAPVGRTDAAGGASLAAGESALFAVDLSRHPAGKETVESTCRFDKSYRFSQRIFPCFNQDYTHRLDAGGDALDLSWCEADRRVPRSPWSVEMKEPAPIAIAAPRNDFESFQIVVRPKGDLAGLTAESSDLVGPDGSVIPKENVRIRWGYYHYVDIPTDNTCARGWYVDALVPITVGRSGEIGAPLTVAAGENQPIFVTVHIPLGVAKGDYLGTVTLRVRELGAGAETVTEVPYKLTVWDFDQPVKNRFQTGYGFWLWNVASYQNASQYADKKAVWERYLQDASDHRISFYDPTPLDGFGVTFDTENLTANFDFTAFDAEMTRVMEKYNITNFVVPIQGLRGGSVDGRPTGSLAGFSGETPEYQKLMADYLGKLQEHLREKGWLDKGYVYWFDEPGEGDYDFVAEGFGTLKKYAPDLARMLTEEPSDKLCDKLDAAGGNIDIWCPISNSLSMPEMRKRTAKGERFWWYVCTGPKAPYCTEFTDHPAHELRLWHWQAFERGITGSLIWLTNYWTSETAFPDSPQNPYDDPMCYSVDYTLAPGVKRPWGNGDGRLLYPPLAAATPGRRDGQVIDEDPVDSLRWEELREGIEDYEILLTLRERFEAKKAALSEEEREEIEKIFDFSELTATLTTFTNDPTLILQRRARAAEAIVRLGE